MSAGRRIPMKETQAEPPLSPHGIESAILLIRGHKVMLSAHLAEIYGVEVRALLQAVRRNVERFPEDFMFQLTPEETEALRSQKCDLRGEGEGAALEVPASRVYSRRGRDAFQRPAEQARDPSEHRDHAHVRETSRTHGFASGSRTEDRRFRAPL